MGKSTLKIPNLINELWFDPNFLRYELSKVKKVLVLQKYHIYLVLIWSFFFKVKYSAACACAELLLSQCPSACSPTTLATRTASMARRTKSWTGTTSAWTSSTLRGACPRISGHSKSSKTEAQKNAAR
jgi:hypothetical protein